MALSFVWDHTLGLAEARTSGNHTAAGCGLMGGELLGALALLAIVFGAVTSITMNDYSGSLAAQAGGYRSVGPGAGWPAG